MNDEAQIKPIHIHMNHRKNSCQLQKNKQTRKKLLKLVEKGKQDIKKGNYLTQKNVFKEMNNWLVRK